MSSENKIAYLVEYALNHKSLENPNNENNNFPITLLLKLISDSADKIINRQDYKDLKIYNLIRLLEENEVDKEVDKLVVVVIENLWQNKDFELLVYFYDNYPNKEKLLRNYELLKIYIKSLLELSQYSEAIEVLDNLEGIKIDKELKILQLVCMYKTNDFLGVLSILDAEKNKNSKLLKSPVVLSILIHIGIKIVEHPDDGISLDEYSYLIDDPLALIASYKDIIENVGNEENELARNILDVKYLKFYEIVYLYNINSSEIINEILLWTGFLNVANFIIELATDILSENTDIDEIISEFLDDILECAIKNGFDEISGYIFYLLAFECNKDFKENSILKQCFGDFDGSLLGTVFLNIYLRLQKKN